MSQEETAMVTIGCVLILFDVYSSYFLNWECHVLSHINGTIFFCAKRPQQITFVRRRRPYVSVRY